MSRSLFLAARVLKNTEETDAAEDKADAYKRIIKTAQVNTVIYKTALDRFLKENHNAVPDQFREVASMMSEFAPIIVQVSLHGQMGTKKLNGVFEQEIQKLVTESK